MLKKKRCHNDNSPLQRPNNGGRKAQKQYDVSTMRMSGTNQNEHHRISHFKQLLGGGGLGGILLQFVFLFNFWMELNIMK